MVNKGYDQYLRSKIMTASKGELTLMLYVVLVVSMFYLIYMILGNKV